MAAAWFSAGRATRLRAGTLYRIIAVLLLLTGVVLLVGHDPNDGGHPLLEGPAQFIAGVAADAVIGVVASLLGATSGELLIPTLVPRSAAISSY